MRRFWAFLLGCFTFASAQLPCLSHAERYEIKGGAPYPNLIVGTIKAVATPEEANLSADPVEFVAKIQLVKKKLWGGEFWTDGYFASTVSKHGDENMIARYVKNQGKVYKKLHEDRQLALF